MKFKYLFIFISIVIISALFVILLVWGTGGETCSFDLVDNFHKAKHSGLSDNSFIKSGYKISGGVRANDQLMNAVSIAFSNPDKIVRHQDNRQYEYFNKGSAGIWLKLLPTDKMADTYRFRIGRSDDGIIYSVEVNASFNGEVRLVSKEPKGGRRVLESTPTRLRKGLEYRIIILSLQNRIVVIHKQRILIDTEIPEKLHDMNFEFSPGKLSDYAKYILKFSSFSGEIEKRIENSLEFQKWGGASFKPIYVDDNNYPNNLAHVFIDEVSRRTVVMPLNSEISITSNCPGEAELEYEIRLLKNTEQTDCDASFSVSIESIDEGKSISRSYRLDDLMEWKDERIDLSAYNNEEIRIHFEVKSNREQFSDQFLLLLANPVLRTARKKDDKNVLLICLDTLRPDHMSVYGYKRKTSPNIDLFTKAAVTFEQAVANSPWTLPSHASMFSSLYPLETGCVLGKNFRQITYSRLNHSVKTLAEYLKESGYKTHAITGNGWVSPHFGFDQGFECYRNVKEKNAAIYLMKQNAIVGSTKAIDGRDFKYSTNLCLKWIEKNFDYKWFFFLHTYEVHAPYTRRHFEPDPADGKAAQTIANYDSGILYADRQVGRIIKRLKELDLFDDTVVLITSDHGESFYKKNGQPEGKDYGRHGHNLYEEQIRVPLIISGIGNAGMKLTDQVRLIDIMPSLLEVCEIDLPENIRGISLLPLIDEVADQTRAAYSEAIRGTKNFDMKSLRFNDCKLILKENYTSNINTYEFYNLLKDPDETIDLSDKAIDRLNSFENIIERIKADIEENRRKLSTDKPVTIDRDIQKQLEQLGYLGKSKTKQ